MSIIMEFFSEFPLFKELFGLGVICVIAATVVFVIWYFRYYRNCTYYKDTKNNYLYIRFFDHGKYGEYLTYKELAKYEKDGAKFLFNTYIPCEGGKTSEIDVMMICQKGIFVFESKNYSGWIFGDEKQKMWTQSLPQGKGKRSLKERFFNPIMQNKGHIKHLSAFIGEEIPLISLIVFSVRCELKKVIVTSSDVTVIKRDALVGCVRKMLSEKSDSLDCDKITELYLKLYPYTQVDENTKKKHIEDIEKSNS